MIPLATRMRPKSLQTFVGQQHLVSENKPLYNVIKQSHLHSMIFWGPPGTGKTTLAEILAASSGAIVEKISAVLAGVKDIRDIVARAELARKNGQPTILFVDEIHRFNKGQQDAFLPHVESGVIMLIGATTENPSFHLNNAFLSRLRVYVLRSLSEDDLLVLLQRALTDKENGLGMLSLDISEVMLRQIAQYADGDARQCLNILEILADFSEEKNDRKIINQTMLSEVLSQQYRRFDKKGDAFYDQISALHKSVRGSDPDAALYWLARMFDGGCDPYYIARRVIRMASEDIGNADPRGLQLALNAWEAFERLGAPEGELAIAQAVIYLACAPKSNATYLAFKQAYADAKEFGSLGVPLHLRNAPTKLMKALDYGKNYRYAHDEPDAFAPGVCYFPEEMPEREYYQPVARGLEIKIQEKLKALKKKVSN